jgi:hypothetical protein
LIINRTCPTIGLWRVADNEDWELLETVVEQGASLGSGTSFIRLSEVRAVLCAILPALRVERGSPVHRRYKAADRGKSQTVTGQQTVFGSASGHRPAPQTVAQG